MGPKEIARLLTEDPDVIEEDVCPKCGSQGDSSFTSFYCSNPRCHNYDAANYPTTCGISPKWVDKSDLSSGYGKSKGGRMFELEFEVRASGVNFQRFTKSPGWYDSTFKNGKNKITVESRYGYVDAWLNDEEKLIGKFEFVPRPVLCPVSFTPQEELLRDDKISELCNQIDKVLNDFERRGVISK